MHSIARRSMLSVTLTVIALTVHHVYSLGAGAFGLGAALLGLSALSLWGYTTTKRTAPFVAYLLVNLWIVVGFGFMSGLWRTVLPLFFGTLLSSASTAYPRPFVGRYAFEASGILTFVGSLFVLSYAVKLIQLRAAERRGEAPQAFGRRAVAAFSAAGTLALVGVLGAYAFVDRDRWVAPAGGVVRIGVIVPTEGPYALLGSSFVKAVEMARDDLKNTKYRYELVIRDSGPDPAGARPVIEKTLRVDRVNAIVGGVSLIGQVTQGYLAKARIPQACVCTVPSIGDGIYSFTNIPSAEAEAVRWVEEARKRGIHRVAVISQDYPSINNHVKALKAEAGRQGLAISYERRFGDDVTDFRGTIAQAQVSQPDVYYVEGFDPALEILGQQLADAGVRNLSSVVAPSLSTKPQLFEGAWYTDSNLRDLGFRKRFEDKYPGVQFATHMMPYAYDSFNMIVQAYEHGVNPAVYLRNITAYEGTADRLTKSPGDGHFRSMPAVWMIRNGKPVRIS